MGKSGHVHRYELNTLASFLHPLLSHNRFAKKGGDVSILKKNRQFISHLRIQKFTADKEI